MGIFNKVRRAFRQSRLESLMTKNGYPIPMRYKYSDEKDTDLFFWKFSNPAESYVFDVLDAAYKKYGADSKEFKRACNELLTSRERELIKANIIEEVDVRNGIALVEDRTFDLKGVYALFEKAKLINNELQLQTPEDYYFPSYMEKSYREEAERHTLYPLAKSAYGSRI